MGALIEYLIEFRLLSAGSLSEWIFVTQDAPIQYQVYIFRKALNNIVHFREASSAFEHQYSGEFFMLE